MASAEHPHRESSREFEGSDVEYRAGQIGDIDDVTALVHRIYDGDPRTRRAALTRAITGEHDYLVVARWHGRVVGYGKAAFCVPVDSDDRAPSGYYLTGLVVDSRWRRRGVGAELTRRRLRWIWSRDKTAWCFTNAANQASIDLHTALGFTEVARAASYLGEPFNSGSGVLMRAHASRPTRSLLVRLRIT